MVVCSYCTDSCRCVGVCSTDNIIFQLGNIIVFLYLLTLQTLWTLKTYNLIDMNYCTLYLVRHGETEWNVKKIIQGHKDSSLTENGINQAESLRKKVARINFAAVYSSDLLRAKRTAELIFLDKKIAIQTSKALRERCFGLFEGKSWESKSKELEILTKLLKDQKKLQEYSQTHPQYKKVETDEQIMGRFITFLREISVAYMNKKVLMVSSGGIMRVFLTHLGWGTREELTSGCVGNTAVVQIDCDGVDFFIRDVEGVKKKTG